MAPDSEGVHPVAHTGRPDRLADVVFVHGLGGSARDTWVHEDDGARFSWPDALADDIPTCGIWSVGYAAGITKFGNPGMVIADRGVNIGKQLWHKQIGVDRPVVFVTHSMGGLVVKALIDGLHDHADDRLRRMVGWIKGIAFCGTPHSGSAFATAAERLSQKLNWAAQEHLKEMHANAEGLDRLNRSFVKWHRSAAVRLKCLVETRSIMASSSLFGRMLDLGLVVPTTSAKLRGVDFTPIDADHLELVKPPGRDALAYLEIIDFIRMTLPEVAADLAAT